MLLMIDNYDSFTFNLSQYFQQLGQTVSVYPHDQIDISTIEQLNPNYLVISPGPNAPADAGISLEVIQHFYQTCPILGVCLGHQCIGQAFGANIIKADKIMHGKTSTITHNRQNLFRTLNHGFIATRYHSLIIDPKTLSSEFSIDAWSDHDIMAISHRRYPVFGVQFHPEAILTQNGLNLLRNFIEYEH